MILIIRGHIRGAFLNTSLRQFVKDIIHCGSEIKIYIHTWNIFSNGISWRELEVDNRVVTKEIIYEYFGELAEYIKEIIIDDDSKIELIGKTDGLINGGMCPLKGWKNYWYGKYRILEYIWGDKTVSKKEVVINMRFDLLNNWINFSYHQLLDFIKRNADGNFHNNVFLEDRELWGMDNIYIGNVYTMITLSNFFHQNLDYVLKENGDTIHQEFLVYRINNKLFG